MCLPYVHVAVICLAIYYLYHLLHHSLHKVSANNPILQPILRYHQEFYPSMTLISLLYFAVIMISLSLSLSTHTHTHIVSTRAGKSPWKAPSTAGFDMMSVRENVVFAFSEASGWTPYMEDR